LTFDYAERNSTDDKRFLKRTVRSAFVKDKIYQTGCPKNAAMEELYPSIKFKFFLILDP